MPEQEPRAFGVPRIRIPIPSPEPFPSGETDYPQQPFDDTPERGPNAATAQPEPLLYVLGGSLDGSNDPDNWTAPLTDDLAQTDTYESWNPPIYGDKVSVSSMSVGATTTVNTGAAHNIPTTGGPYLVKISGVTGITSTPSINGKHWVNATDADTFTINLLTSGTLGGAGLVGTYCNGVKMPTGNRLYETAFGGGPSDYQYTNEADATVYGIQWQIYAEFSRVIDWYNIGAFKISAESAEPNRSLADFNAT